MTVIHRALSAPAWPRRRFIGGLGLLSVTLIGCAQARPPAASAANERVVEGSVGWRERIALPPNAELLVALNDVSRMDAPAVTLAEQRIPLAGRQPPHSFRLAVDASRIEARNRYVVAARVMAGGQLLFINDTAYPVLTQGAGRQASMMLVRVQR